MAYVENNLLPSETISKKAEIHWFIYMPGILLLLFALFSLLSVVETGIFFLLISLCVLLSAFIKAISTELAITNKRVIAKYGFISRKTIELNLTKVESLNVDQGIFGRIFNFGTMTVNGTGGIKTPFKFIDDPLLFRKTVNEEIEKINVK